jgi:hypothetical protein
MTMMIIMGHECIWETEQGLAGEGRGKGKDIEV